MGTSGPRHDSASLAIRAKLRLGLTNREFANFVGTSLRTVERLSPGRGLVYSDWLTKLAVAVYPKDAALAAEVAAGAGQTLESLGLVVPAPRVAPSPPAPQRPAPEPPAPLRAIIAESVVAAAAEALDVSPRVARPALLAAMDRASAAGLTVADLLVALRPHETETGRKKTNTERGTGNRERGRKSGE
jgi:hypothetical protein